MKKIYIWACVILFTVSLVSAIDETNLGIHLDSDGGNINTWVYPSSGIGETNYYLDGKNFDDEVNRLDRADVHDGIFYYFYSFRNLFMEETNPNSWVFKPVEFNSLTNEGRKYRYTMESWFVPRAELITIINQQQNQITQLSYEMKALQKMFTEEQLCDARMQIVKEFNLTSVDCGSMTYYNHLEGDSLIGLRQIG